MGHPTGSRGFFGKNSPELQLRREQTQGPSTRACALARDDRNGKRNLGEKLGKPGDRKPGDRRNVPRSFPLHWVAVATHPTIPLKHKALEWATRPESAPLATAWLKPCPDDESRASNFTHGKIRLEWGTPPVRCTKIRAVISSDISCYPEATRLGRSGHPTYRPIKESE